jgi:hypothetical protein
MMKFEWSYDLHKLHRRERLHQAQQEALATALRRANQSAPVYRPLLANLGRTLVAWGEELQTRYAAEPAPHIRPLTES